MNKEQYIEMRNKLIQEGEELINSGKFEDFQAKKAEIESLDLEFENAAKAQANLNALKDNSKVINLANHSVPVVGATTIATTTNKVDVEDMLNTIEYRKAFMNHVLTGEKMSNEFKNAASPEGVTKTTDIGVMIPTVILEKIVEKIEAAGMILPLVTRTAYKGGVSIPTSNVKPVAVWVGEGQGSKKQKKTLGANITFAYHKLRCAVSVTLETDTMSLAVFETNLIQGVAKAMVVAIEESIIKGTGEGQPKGILTEEVPEERAIEVSELNYKIITDTEGAIPLEYEEGGVYCMTKRTFMNYMGIVGADGHPIARVTYGITGKPERTLLGRTVVLCNYLPSFDTADPGEVFAFVFNFADYCLNTNFNMGIKQYEDNETDDIINKSVMLLDGKVVVNDSLVVLKKSDS